MTQVYSLYGGRGRYDVILENANGPYSVTISEGTEGVNVGPVQSTSTTGGEEGDTIQADCIVSVGANVNLRSGPGTTFDVAGTLAAGERAGADGQSLGDDGFIWWHLLDGSWVRSDVVATTGACEDLPEITP